MVEDKKDNKLTLLEAEKIERFRYRYGPDGAICLEPYIDKMRKFLSTIGDYVGEFWNEGPKGNPTRVGGFTAYHLDDITIGFYYDVYEEDEKRDVPDSVWKKYKEVAARWQREYKSDDGLSEKTRRLFKKVDKDGRRYTTIPLHAPGETRNGPTGQEWRGIKPPKGRHWRSEPKALEELDRAGLIEWSKNGVPRKKIYADEKDGKKKQDIWEYKDAQYPSYPTEKNLEMLKTIILASSDPGDLILDCFCGSGTTLQAAGELGRNWIGIDESAEAIKVAKERLSKIEKDFFLNDFEYQYLEDKKYSDSRQRRAV